MKLANAKRVDYAHRSDTAYAAWKEKQTSDGIKGIEEQDQMVNDYTDRKEKAQKSRPSWPPCFLHGGPWGVSATGLYDQYCLGYVAFTAQNPNVPMPSGPVVTGYGGACKEATAPGQY